ncbi:uncharacterized protein [Halyomorpha halys]|uniref:uncharacterized protein n=1 Tax=Halyomorpha halys TaxID=286706 RepID=UPI0006D523F3
MRIVPSNTVASYTLPHHAVVKNHKNSMKLRTVFDASCKTRNGSLNDHLFTSPKLQLDIRDILTHFRTHQVVCVADIVKMYRQILVHPPDRKYQHILWRFDPQDTVQQFELCTVTYGTSSAPFQAQRAIIQLVRDEGDPYPWASKVLQEDIYVDDIATGAASVDEAKQLASELEKLLSKGFSNWVSGQVTVQNY